MGIEDKAVAFIAQRDWVSLTELQGYLSEDMETRGNSAIVLGDHLVLYHGASHAFCDLVIALFQQERIFPHASSPLVYLMDGWTTSMPVAKRPPKDGYKSDRWLPVCLRTVPDKKMHRRNPSPSAAFPPRA